MKITRKYLRRIIREEYSRLLQEQRSRGVDLDYGSFEQEEDAIESLRNPDYLGNYDEDGNQWGVDGHDDWGQWAEGYGLVAEEDQEGQVIFYVDPIHHADFMEDIVDEAMAQGAQIEEDNEGQTVIYTGFYNAN